MPLAVRFLSRKRLVHLLCMALVAAPIARLSFIKFLPKHPAAPYMLTVCRADALAMGVLLAIAWRDQNWKARFLHYRVSIAAASSALLIVFVYLAFWNPSQYSSSMAAWGFSCLDLFFALLLARALLLPGGIWAAVCRWRFLAEMGRISYCFYVIHAAVNLFTHLLILHREPRFADAPSIEVTVVAAVLAYRNRVPFVEILRVPATTTRSRLSIRSAKRHPWRARRGSAKRILKQDYLHAYVFTSTLQES